MTIIYYIAWLLIVLLGPFIALICEGFERLSTLSRRVRRAFHTQDDDDISVCVTCELHDCECNPDN